MKREYEKVEIDFLFFDGVNVLTSGEANPETGVNSGFDPNAGMYWVEDLF